MKRIVAVLNLFPSSTPHPLIDSRNMPLQKLTPYTTTAEFQVEFNFRIASR
ncbi:MAG: hypothetical protein KKD01_19025 [Proteobacteria bacterium]|nr:hypothetical protein [Pseudomonadota bacterium]MBU1418460.1 hypothetical protein [Pseudomonadota bacterium]MBU1456816.1 hypothetical protein [Pseudomonadota bacterium]